MTLRDAYKEVQNVRNIICPNVGFFKQMIELEEKVIFPKGTHPNFENERRGREQ